MNFNKFKISVIAQNPKRIFESEVGVYQGLCNND